MLLSERMFHSAVAAGSLEEKTIGKAVYRQTFSYSFDIPQWSLLCKKCWSFFPQLSPFCSYPLFELAENMHSMEVVLS